MYGNLYNERSVFLETCIQFMLMRGIDTYE